MTRKYVSNGQSFRIKLNDGDHMFCVNFLVKTARQVEIAYLSRQSFSTWISRCDQLSARGPPYLRFCADSATMLDELVETATEGVVFIIPMLDPMLLEQSRYTGMLPPDPLGVAHV
mgnify:CR=1 FL=1